MHADIERYTVNCARDYNSCLTITLEQDGRKLIAKRCANDSICKKEITYCNGRERKTVGGRKTETCKAWCCEGYMCNNVSRLSPAAQLVFMVLGFTFVALK